MNRQEWITELQHRINASRGNYIEYIDLLVEDAEEIISLLKEQEVRLLTEEEAKAWCEDYNGETVRKKPLVEEYLRPFDKAHWFEWITPEDDYSTADIVGYNEQVRLWTGMPTEEQWKAKKWKGVCL